MATAPTETQRATRFLIPHRTRRLIPKVLLFGLVAGPLAGASPEPAEIIALTCWMLIACFVLVRTWRAAIIVDNVTLVAVRGISTRRVECSEITVIDLQLPHVGEFTQGNGERMVAVLKSGKQVSLAFLPLTRRPCRHLSEIARSLNKVVGESPAG
jgi:hypothetical protein